MRYTLEIQKLLLQKRLYIQYMHHMLKQFIVSLYLQ